MTREAPEQRVNYSFLPDCVSEVIGAPLDFSNQMSFYVMIVDTIRELLKNGFKHNLVMSAGISGAWIYADPLLLLQY